MTAVGNIKVRAWQLAIAYRISRMECDSPSQRQTQLGIASCEQLTDILEALHERVNSTVPTQAPHTRVPRQSKYIEYLGTVRNPSNILGFNRTRSGVILPHRREPPTRIDPVTCQQPLKEIKTRGIQ